MSATKSILKHVLIAAVTASLIACSASSQFSRSAQEQKLLREDITVNNLPLVIFRDVISSGSPTIHFYIDGDGSPWVGGRRVAKDPTSRSKLILSLMAEDLSKKILLGRPCYYLSPAKRPHACSEKWWTSDRYSDQVVAAMSQLMAAQIQRFNPQKVRLIGYSGGGTLAMLIASRMSSKFNIKVESVVTIAANLDVDRWLVLHQFTALSNSLNQANFPVLPEDIRQFHFVGSEDNNVPGEITRAVVSRQRNAQLVEVEGYSHECCWPKDWASRLETLVPR